MEVGEEEKEDEKQWIISIPIIDLGCFAEDELWKLAVCSSRTSLLQQSEEHIHIPKINRAVFNESAASKRQTYRKWDLQTAPHEQQQQPAATAAAARSTIGVMSASSLSARKIQSTAAIEALAKSNLISNVGRPLLSTSSSTERGENGHQPCKLGQTHPGLETVGGSGVFRRGEIVQEEARTTVQLAGAEVAAAAAGKDLGSVHLKNRGDGAAGAFAGAGEQKRRQPNDANHHHHHHHHHGGGGSGGAHSLHQLHKSLKSTQKQSPREEQHCHTSQLGQERVAQHDGSAAELSLSMAGMMMMMMSMGPPAAAAAAASLGQQQQQHDAESEPEMYAEMMKQQLNRKNGTWTTTTTANMDGKVVHAQGFPKGWTVSVGLRHKTGRLFYEYKQWKSPDGKIWGSFKEAATHMVRVLQQEHFFNVIAPPRPSCPVCEQSNPSLVHLTNCCPTRDPEWMCKVCDRIFSNSEALRIHQSAHASNQVVPDHPLKAAVTGLRNPFEAETIASTPETYPACGTGGGPCSSSHTSCDTCTTDPPQRWICKICECVYSNSEALRIHENGHALASRVLLTSKRCATDCRLQHRNCNGQHGEMRIPRERQESGFTEKEDGKIHRNLANRGDGLTKRDFLLEGMMDASRNHQRVLFRRILFDSREEFLCVSCDTEQKASLRSKHFGRNSRHLSSFSCTGMLEDTEVAPSNSVNPIYGENPGSADVSESSDASNYSDEPPPKEYHGFQMGFDKNGTHADHGACESPTCHEHFLHKVSLFSDPLASFKTRRNKPTQAAAYDSEIIGSVETLGMNFDPSKTGLETKNREVKSENESASVVQGQPPPMHEIFQRMIQNSAHVGSTTGTTHASNATVTAFLEKEKAEDMRHGTKKAEIFEEDHFEERSAANTELLQWTINANVLCTEEAQGIHTILNMQSQYSSDEGGAEQEERCREDEYQSPAQSPDEEGDCNVCGTHEKGAPEQVYCDCCGAGFHWSCVSSEPQPIPAEGSWMCPECENEHF